MPEQANFISEYLLKNGIISPQQLREITDEESRTNGKFEEIIVRRRFAKEEDIAAARSQQLGFAFLDLYSYQIDTEAASLMPVAVAVRLKVIPVFKVADSLTVAMNNPLDVEAIDEISRIAGQFRIKPILATPSAIHYAIQKYYGKEVFLAPQFQAQPAAAVLDAKRLLEAAAQVPVVTIVNKLVEDAVRSAASDIHLEQEEDNFYCRFRVDGVLHEVEAPPKNMQLAVISRIKIMAEMDIAQSRLPQDGRIELKVAERDIDLRITTFPTIYGEHVAIRILDKTQGIIKLEEMGFQEEALLKFKEVIHKPYGLVLVTGPTGSGKTTTLYSALNTINDLEKNIITLEDPVEYTIPHIHQSQVNVKAGLTFASGLRSIVRLDPDIIMIGEIRDKETADIAIHSSLTGHLVFSTLHTNDAPSAAARLVDIGVEPYLLSSSLIGVLAQRLVRKLCPKCKQEYKPSKEELAVCGERLAASGKASFYKSKGCPECRNSGYKGRTGIYELLIPDNTLKEMIIKKAPAYELREEAQKSGMKTLRKDGLEKVMQGLTSLAEVLRVTEEV